MIKQNDSVYYVGLKMADDNPFDEVCNPDGIIQLGLDDNKVIDLWIVFNCLLFSAGYSWQFFDPLRVKFLLLVGLVSSFFKNGCCLVTCHFMLW